MKTIIIPVKIIRRGGVLRDADVYYLRVPATLSGSVDRGKARRGEQAGEAPGRIACRLFSSTKGVNHDTQGNEATRRGYRDDAMPRLRRSASGKH